MSDDTAKRGPVDRNAGIGQREDRDDKIGGWQVHRTLHDLSRCLYQLHTLSQGSNAGTQFIILNDVLFMLVGPFNLLNHVINMR